MKRWGNLLLAVWLIAAGVLALFSISFPYQDTLLAGLAVAAGLFILVEGRGLSWRRNLGVLLLAVWLVAIGLVSLLNLRLPASEQLLAILGLAAGVLLLLKR
jgi:uncharacterized protein YhhL (DUF1145 family)